MKLLVIRKKRELVYVREKGKRVDVIMPNSFGSLMKLGEGDKWTLSIVDNSPPTLQVDDTVMVLRRMLLITLRSFQNINIFLV